MAVDIVAEHAQLDLVRINSLLDHDLPVILRGSSQSSREFFSCMDLGNANGRSKIRGLHEHRVWKIADMRVKK